MKLSDLDTKEKEPLKVHQPGARAYLVSRNFISDKEIVSELMGNYPGNANKISVKTIKTEEGNHLIVAGNDGGLEEDDIKKLLGCFIPTHNTLEHSEHGQGSRAAGSSLTREAKESNFCIVSRRIIKGINQFKGVTFVNGVEDGYNTIDTLEMKESDAAEMFNSFQTPIDDSGDVSKWICGCKEDALKKNENEELDVQYDIKMRYSKQIMEKEVEIYCQDKILKIEHQFIDNELSDTLKIWKVKEKMTLQYLAKKEYLLFQINNKYYHLNNTEYRDYRKKKMLPDLLGEDKNKFGILVDEEKFIKQSKMFEFEASMFHPNPEKRQQIAKEYSMTDSKRKKNGGSDRRITDYNGVYYLKQNVLLSTTSITFGSLRKAGTSPGDVYIMAIQPTGNGEKTGIQTLVQKDLSPRLDNEVTNLMKIYYDDYRNSKTTTDTDSTDTVTNNTHNTSSPPPPPSASNDTDLTDTVTYDIRNTPSQSQDGGARSERVASSRYTGERESKRPRTEEDSTSQTNSSTQYQFNKKDEDVYFYLFTMFHPVENSVDPSWLHNDKPIYKFGITVREPKARLLEHINVHPKLRMKLIFLSKNRGPSLREKIVIRKAKKEHCSYRQEFLCGDKNSILDIIKTELTEEEQANEYTQKDLDRIVNEISS